MELTDFDTALGDSEVIQNNADIDGTYPDMVVGNMLSNTGLTDMVPYNFRASAGGPREYDEIVGGTVAWNQLVQNGNFADGSSHWYSNGSINGTFENGIAILTTSEGGDAFYANDVSMVVNHKYLFVGQCKVSNAENSAFSFKIFFGGAANALVFSFPSTGTAWTEQSGIFVCASNQYNFVRLYAGVTNHTYQYKNVRIFDLTAAFGTTIADHIYALEQATSGAGVAWLRNNGFMTKDYYAYNAGSLESVKTSGHVMTGKNLFDKDHQNVFAGFINTQTGDFSESSNYKTIYIPCLQNTTYTISKEVGKTFRVASSYNIPSGGVPYINTSANHTASELTFTTGDSARYLAVLYWSSQNGDTKTADELAETIQIELGSTATAYEPYRTWSYPLDSSLTLRGIMTLDADNEPYYDGDTYASDGTVTRRYGIVDLGTLNWRQLSSRTDGYYADNLPNGPLSVVDIPQGICAKYAETWLVAVNMPNMTFKFDGTALGYIYIVNSSFVSDVAGIKNALSGVYLVYKLATPTTDTATPFTSPQTVDPYGTEAYTDAAYAAGDRDFELPVGHETFYPTDQVAKLDGLPSDLSMIAPIENGTTASQAYSTGQYFMKNNKFCKALTSIASGATFTLGTNYSVTTIAAELYTAINS